MNDLASLIDNVGVQLETLDGQISEVRGSFWQPYANRDMGQLDDDVDTLERELLQTEQCVDSIVRAANGSGSYAFC